MGFTRDEAAMMAAEAVEVMTAGEYTAPGGQHVEIRDALARAHACTVSYPPGTNPPPPGTGSRVTRVEVVNTTTLNAAHRLVARGLRPAALNFASATNPGGGFLGGARAQEESLCWSSGLYQCLHGQAMYRYHQEREDWLFTDYVLYSPDVPVFRSDVGALLAASWNCSFLTSPAPMSLHYMAEHPEGGPELAAVFRSRIAKVLAVAAHHGHAELVLGAWGCGAFGGDAEMVAPLFREALEGPFAGVFSTVVFAILDSEGLQLTIGPFAKEFGATL